MYSISVDKCKETNWGLRKEGRKGAGVVEEISSSIDSFGLGLGTCDLVESFQLVFES